ncbi:MAG: aspartate aminotransferase family protein, partial [Rhizobiales bacterium]|nr:aspartate aminotransferase family protein [Hyphomicrobiales bacterium]
MDTSALEKWGPELSHWASEYLNGLRERPVRAQMPPGDIASQIPASPPNAPEDFAALFSDFENLIMPGITHWQHPRFFAYFPANSSPPG